jgi:hypothetical protein
MIVFAVAVVIAIVGYSAQIAQRYKSIKAQTKQPAPKTDAPVSPEAGENTPKK